MKKKIIWGTVIVIILFLGSIIYYEVTRVVDCCHGEQNEQVPVSAWKTFADEHSFITFKYPSNWVATLDTSKSPVVKLKLQRNGTEYETIYFTTPMPEVGYEGDKIIENKMISTQSGYSFKEVIAASEDMDGAYPFDRIARVTYLLDDYSKSFVATLQYRTDSKTAQEVFEKLISSIEFTK